MVQWQMEQEATDEGMKDMTMHNINIHRLHSTSAQDTNFASHVSIMYDAVHHEHANHGVHACVERVTKSCMRCSCIDASPSVVLVLVLVLASASVACVTFVVVHAVAVVAIPAAVIVAGSVMVVLLQLSVVSSYPLLLPVYVSWAARAHFPPQPPFYACSL